MIAFSVTRRLRRTCSAVALFSFAALAAAPASAEISGGVVRIGVINDQSGPLSDPMGPGSVIAARLAVADFRKANPKLQVEIVTADHQNKPDIGATTVRKWFDVDGVDMVVDIGNSAVGLAVQNIIRERNKIAIYSAVATTELNGKQCAPTGLAWQHDSYNLVSGPIRTLVPQGQNSWFFIAADYAFGHNMVAESERVLAQAGGKTAGRIFHPIGASDYSSFLLQAQSSGAKVVAFANAGAQLVNSMKQWNEFGMNAGTQKPVAQLMFITDVHSMGPDISQGLTALTAFYWDVDDATRAFGRRFFEAHKAMPTSSQAAVYSGVLHYLRGVAASGSDQTDAVLKWMKSNPVDDFYAKGATIREDNKLVHDFFLVEVKKPADVKTPWGYYDVLARVPAKDVYFPLSESECPLVKK
ncbi:ABC transporter substrate-binding protein [Enterovirga aerilata]|uniref:ABC transporter substrate-binding protein n=1 Tax=Enterovirga aerilata TaxID=2730920 RepID=A0A849I2Z7_9HYPH|nr:ABC transporter substrate-binding protein [Enterovirga sp. DB1703]NNM74176.1 ABC transporter substrate-binding protein [Enterovirga sp. DB1703]